MVFAILAGSEGADLEGFGVFEQNRCVGLRLAGRAGDDSLHRTRGIVVGAFILTQESATQNCGEKTCADSAISTAHEVGTSGPAGPPLPPLPASHHCDSLSHLPGQRSALELREAEKQIPRGNSK